MIYGIIGTYNSSRIGLIRGNGKTISATYYGYKDYIAGRKVFSNFFTTYSEMISINDLVKKFRKGELDGALIIWTEAQLYFPHNMSKDEKEILIGEVVSQTRKTGNDIILDTQRFRDLNLSLRAHVDQILIPEKIHYDGTECNIDKCNEPHIINIYNLEDLDTIIKSFNADKIYNMYNSNERISDRFDVTLFKPKKEKLANMSIAQLEKILEEKRKELELKEKLINALECIKT